MASPSASSLPSSQMLSYSSASSSTTPPPTPEEIPMDEDQLRAYAEVQSILQAPSTFLAPLSAVIPIHEGLPPDATTESPSPGGAVTSNTLFVSRSPFRLEPPSSPRSPRFGDTITIPRNQLLQEALSKLEGLEKEEQCLIARSDVCRQLTQAITEEVYANTSEALTRLTVLGEAVPRRVCQHPFRKNDLVWVCRTCQADETCVLCHACFSQSNHEGHDVNIFHTAAAGCCDCGDPNGRSVAFFIPALIFKF